MNKHKFTVVHCSATPPWMNVTKSDIERWHLKERQWTRLGYSDLIQLDGTLVSLTEFNHDDIIQTNEMTWGVSGINRYSRHVCYAGGLSEALVPADTRTKAQLYTMEIYLRHEALRNPNVKICGHNQFANKACPSFDVPTWLKSINFPTENIYTGD
jgi:N-acetylmuramoyl-L-alanine amidase